MGAKAQKQTQNQIGNRGIVDKMIFALLSMLIIGAPLFKGSFFEREIMISNIFAFSIFLIFLFNKNKKGEKLTLFNSPYDYIGLLFIVFKNTTAISIQSSQISELFMEIALLNMENERLREELKLNSEEVDSH